MIKDDRFTQSASAAERRLGFRTLLLACTVAAALMGCVRDEEGLTGDTADPGATPQPPGATPPPAPPPSAPPDDTTPPPVDPATPTTQPPATDVAAFEQTLYPLLRSTANFCVGCHGVTQIPTFAVADVMTAYNVITTQQKVNLTNPALSRVYLRPAVDRHNCGGDATCDRVAADFLAGDPGLGGDPPRDSAAGDHRDHEREDELRRGGLGQRARRRRSRRAVPVRRRRGHDHRRHERRRSR